MRVFYYLIWNSQVNVRIYVLKDLSDSIDRIFFVGNRMDGVPENEISDVVLSLESSLKITLIKVFLKNMQKYSQ